MNLFKEILYSAYDRIPDRIKLGSVYAEKRKMISSSVKWDRKRVDEWLLSTFRSNLAMACNDTIYYKKLIVGESISSADIKTHSDIKELPFMTKSIAQDNLDQIVSSKYKQKELYYTTTGGSTGIPLGVYYLKKRAKSDEMAFVHDIWSRFNYAPNKKQVVVRGEVIKEAIASKKGLTLYLSSYHLTDENMPVFIKTIMDYRPRYIQAYPSAITSICNYMKEQNVPKFKFLDLVMCSSENLYDFQRDLVKEVLEVPVVNLYGNTEHTCIASNCPESEFLHFYPQYGYVELINAADEECTEEGEAGEIVSTNFTNPAFPLIRYRTGDIATYTRTQCSCNWNYKLVTDIQGREQEFIITDTGRKICIAAVNMHSNIFDHIKQFQFLQRQAGHVFFDYVSKDTFTIGHKEHIYLELKKKLGLDVEVKMRAVSGIESTKSGKHRFLVQELDT